MPNYVKKFHSHNYLLCSLKPKGPILHARVVRKNLASPGWRKFTVKFTAACDFYMCVFIPAHIVGHSKKNIEAVLWLILLRRVHSTQMKLKN